MNTWSAPGWNAPTARTGDRPLRVGLVNNMPDGAVLASERQFRHLLEVAAGGRPLELILFQIPKIERSPAVRERLAARYRPAEDVGQSALDALVVTGASPGMGPLRQAPFWPAFARLVETAATLRLPTLWSCLAAHAAVEHLDGVARRPLPSKYAGLFPVTAVGDHPWLTGVGPELQIPHSRCYDLAEADLLQRGYQVLTRGPTVGVDTFMRPGAVPFLFWQGHPEYEADTLAREYQRDLRQHRQGDLALAPAPLSGLGDPALPAASAALWREAGARLIGNWLNSVLSRQPAECIPVQN